jgi:hypothetical protein
MLLDGKPPEDLLLSTMTRQPCRLSLRQFKLVDAVGFVCPISSVELHYAIRDLTEAEAESMRECLRTRALWLLMESF